jgi:hypothetical protein
MVVVRRAGRRAAKGTKGVGRPRTKRAEMSVQRIGLALAALVASAGSSLGQAPTTIWTRSMPANQLNLQAQLGDEAGAIFVFPTQNSGSMLQLSPYAAPTAQPLVSGTYAPGNGTLRLSVAARAATAATVNWATGSSTPRLNFWRLGEAQPDAGWNLPFAPTYTSTLGVHCTADGGGAYVWVLDQSASNLALWRVAANGQLAWTTTVAAGTSPSVRPTEDGTRVLVVGTLRTFLLDGSNCTSPWTSPRRTARVPRCTASRATVSPSRSPRWTARSSCGNPSTAPGPSRPPRPPAAKWWRA